VFRRSGADRLDIAGEMQPLNDRKIGERRQLALQAAKSIGRHRVVDGAQAVRPLWVALAGVVQKADRMSEEERRHEQIA